MPRVRAMEDRFWEKVDRSEGDDACWLWLGAISGATPHRLGYGVIGTGEGTKNMKAHRYSWELHNGLIPKTREYHGLCVCHHCDIPCASIPLTCSSAPTPTT